MSEYQQSNLHVNVKQAEIITPANKRYMIFFTTTVVMLSVGIIITSFTL